MDSGEYTQMSGRAGRRGIDTVFFKYRYQCFYIGMDEIVEELVNDCIETKMEKRVKKLTKFSRSEPLSLFVKILFQKWQYYVQ